MSTTVTITETPVEVTVDETAIAVNVTETTTTVTVAASITDHGALSGLSDDDHTQYLLKAGGTMTGALVLSGDPDAALKAATKQYVDAAGGGGVTDHGALTGLGDDDHTQYLLVDGTRAMTGALTLSGAPTLDLHAATKKYVDDNAGGGGASDVDGLTTDTGNAGEMVRVDSLGTGLEYRTTAQVLADIGAVDKTGDTMTGGLTVQDNVSFGLNGAALSTSGDVSTNSDAVLVRRAMNFGTTGPSAFAHILNRFGILHGTSVGGIRLFKQGGNPADVVDIHAVGTTVNNGIADHTPLGVLHVKQVSLTGAKPPLVIEQQDVSEEMIEMYCTAGVGNAIEAVGGKTLTVTEFIKVTVNGQTRYIEIGTIA